MLSRRSLMKHAGASLMASRALSAAPLSIATAAPSTLPARDAFVTPQSGLHQQCAHSSHEHWLPGDACGSRPSVYNNEADVQTLTEALG